MIPGANLQFFIKKDATTYYKVVNDVVLETTVPTPLQYSLGNWEEFAISWVRDDQLWGVFRLFTPEIVRFVKDGQKICKYIFYTQGFQGQAILEIRILNNLTKEYDFLTEADMDFSEGSDPRDFFPIKLAQRGVPEFLENKRDMPAEIPFDLENVLTCKVDGLKIQNAQSWSPNFYYSGDTAGAGAIGGTGSLIGIFRDSELGKGYLRENTPFVEGGGPSNFFFVSTTDGDVLSISLRNVKVYTFFGGLILMNVYNSSGGFVSTIYSKTLADDTEYILNDDILVTLNNGDRVLYLITVDPGHSESLINYMEISDASDTLKATVSATGVIQFAETTNKAYRYYNLGQHLFSNLSDGQYNIISSFLQKSVTEPERLLYTDNSPYSTMITSGDGIRGVPDAKLKTTIGDWLKFAWFRWACGAGQEGDSVRIEPIKYWLDKDVKLFTCNNINNFTSSIWKEKTYNQIDLGYGSYSYDQLSGKEEFNTNYTWAIKEVTRVTQTDNLRTNYRADVFGWEYLRNQLSEQATGITANNSKDNNSDNDVFLIETETVPVSGFYVPRRPEGFISGFTQASQVYNATLDTKRALLTHVPRYRSMISSGELTLQRSDKNDQFFSYFTLPYNTNSEIDLANDSFGDLPLDRLYQNYIFEFDCVPPASLPEIMATGSRGYVDFLHNGILFKGFIMEVGIKPGKPDSMRFKLLSHPDNDLTQLI